MDNELIEDLYDMLPHLIAWGDKISFRKFYDAMKNGYHSDCPHHNCCFSQAQAAFSVMQDYAQRFGSHMLDSQRMFIRFLNLVCESRKGKYDDDSYDSYEEDSEED